MTSLAMAPAGPDVAVPTARVPRCRKLSRLGNRCPNPEIEDTGLCAHHLAQAAEDFRRLVRANPYHLARRGRDGS